MWASGLRNTFKKKVEKLKEVKEPVILLINRKLKCSEKDFPAQEVIFFDRKIPANEVMQVLRKYEGQKLSEDLSKTAGNGNPAFRRTGKP